MGLNRKSLLAIYKSKFLLKLETVSDSTTHVGKLFQIENPKIFHIIHVTKCVASDVGDHLRLIKVEVISCYFTFKKGKNGDMPDESLLSNYFRFYFDTKFSDLVNRKISWLEHVVIHNNNNNLYSAKGNQLKRSLPDKLVQYDI
ncbi:hypothetical protein HELRODRAFT_175924 [Helobdella robusta]|uniref:Uncharacterized protein n=1 Tax=Helobdella robusta TaxID=6412 RepID=T1F9W5_HELRO|nr:hypothetical protein HELRODRAFT_175924 [Helobdella robusta]ESO00486.1 hypothetical protein HELRODRAFT_175924 [Helobdella robusta]